MRAAKKISYSYMQFRAKILEHTANNAWKRQILSYSRQKYSSSFPNGNRHQIFMWKSRVQQEMLLKYTKKRAFGFIEPWHSFGFWCEFAFKWKQFVERDINKHKQPIRWNAEKKTPASNRSRNEKERWTGGWNGKKKASWQIMWHLTSIDNNVIVAYHLISLV